MKQEELEPIVSLEHINPAWTQEYLEWAFSLPF